MDDARDGRTDEVERVRKVTTRADWVIAKGLVRMSDRPRRGFMCRDGPRSGWYEDYTYTRWYRDDRFLCVYGLVYIIVLQYYRTVREV